jgi:division protein CdvB (Snf7/Vps24/ESCRT-III family)
MTTLLDTLHDEIDEQEALAEEARGVVDEAKAHLLDLVDDLQDTEAALAAVAVLVEDGLADVTKRAVRSGYEAAKRRAQRLADEG